MSSSDPTVAAPTQFAPAYLAIAVATAIVCCAAAALIGLAIDPFGAYRLVAWPHVNAAKPEMQTRIKLAKAYDVRRLRPETIVLGTSRSHLGLRMTHPGWAGRRAARYNLAFDGATTREMYAYLRHAYAVHPLRQVVLGLDTWHLNNAPSPVRPDFDPDFLYVPDSPLQSLRVFGADVRLLLSLDTLRAAIATVLHQEDAGPEWLAADGQRLGDPFFHRPGEAFMTEGPGAYFAAIDREEIGYHLDAGPPPRDARRPSPVAGPPAPSSLDYVGKIIAFCRARGIDLRIYITPAHVHQLEIARALGEWPAIEDGKRAVVRMLAEDARAHPGATPFLLVDFSGFSSITTEPVPPAGSAAEMRYYWDSSHFKERVGDLVLDRLLDVPVPVPDDFGVLLTPDSVEAALSRTRRDEAQYRRTHAADVAAIDGMIATTRSRLAGSTPLRTVALEREP